MSSPRLALNLNALNALARSARNRASDLNAVVTNSVPGRDVDQQPIYDEYDRLVEAMNDLESYLYPRGRHTQDKEN